VSYCDGRAYNRFEAKSSGKVVELIGKNACYWGTAPVC